MGNSKVTSGTHISLPQPRHRPGRHEGTWPESAGDTCTTVPQSTYGVTLTPNTASAIGNPDQMVTYALAAHNTDNAPDAYTVTLGAHTWETTPASVMRGPAAADTTATLEFSVTIPAVAQERDSEL